MSKQKRKKLTFWSKYKMPIIAIVAFSAIVYVIIYLVFKENGIFPVGTGLEKSDWLSFLGAYLSFIGTVIVSLIATVYKGNIIKNLIMDCQSYTKYRPNETTGGIFVSWRRKEELPTGA